MTKTIVLPPGVPLEIYDSLPKSTLYFDGEGQAGNWTDPASWWGGTLPGSTSLVVVPVNATLNGSFTTETVMFLGNETVTINGALTTTNPNFCESFMVCDEAVAVFNPGASLSVAGSMIVGNDDYGSLIAKQHATLTTAIGKIGRLDAGIGTVTIDGAQWTNSSEIVVGSEGSGTLNVLDNGQVDTGGNLVVGDDKGSTGQVTLSSGSTLAIGGALEMGSGAGNANGEGVAAVTINTGAVMSIAAGMNIFTGNTLTLAGGTLQAGPLAAALRIQDGGTLSGFGTITAATAGVADVGTIVATGGTLVINGPVGGQGTIDIAAGSTLQINASMLAKVDIGFTGAAGSLALSHGITDLATISGFSAGDTILMPGVDAIAWSALTNVLTLSDQGHVVDKMHFAGTYAGDPFTLSQSSAGAVIGLTLSH
jgi:T5SS/PEP-CTERM-associated repeat protein